VVSCDQNDWCPFRHANQHVDPEVPFPNRLLVRSQVPVNHKEVNVVVDRILDKPLCTLSGITEMAILFQMNVSSMGHAVLHKLLLV
jgi:hypothetical protein